MYIVHRFRHNRFDALGRVVSRSLDRDGSGTLPVMTRSYGYDAATGALSVVRAGWGAVPVVWFQDDVSVRDAVGNVVSVTDRVWDCPWFG